MLALIAMNVTIGGPLRGLSLGHPFGKVSHVMKIRDSGRGLVRCLSLAAAAMLALSAAAGQRAEALSLINPGAVPTAKYASNGLTTEVRGGHGHGGHGGAFRGGGFRSGGAAVFRGGGFRQGGFGIRHHRHHFHRHFYYAPSDYYPYRRCRIIRTYYGPRRICHYRQWHHGGYPLW
jgi:hypothetical protein